MIDYTNCTNISEALLAIERQTGMRREELSRQAQIFSGSWRTAVQGGGLFKMVEDKLANAFGFPRGLPPKGKDKVEFTGWPEDDLKWIEDRWHDMRALHDIETGRA